MTTRAKFKVDYVQEYEYCKTVKLSPVYGINEENKVFWDATPSGSIELMVSNKSTVASFTPGSEFYIDFTPAN